MRASRFVRVLALNALLGTAGVVGLADRAEAALDLPAPSPAVKTTQRVGVTDITVEYSSPGVKGRAVWGTLVPWGQVWRTGANQATKITFSEDVEIGGTKVPKGTYSVFTIPAEKGPWTFILNKTTAHWGTETYKQGEDAVRVQVVPEAISNRERLTFLFADTTDDTTRLDLEWEKVRLGVTIKVPTNDHAGRNIEGYRGEAWRSLAQAARYLLESGQDLAQAQSLVDQAIAIDGSQWYAHWIKALIHHKKGDKKGAIAEAQKAWDLGSKSERFFYKDWVKQSLEEWKKK